MNMRKSKNKRVTWASDVNLTQVRLFLSEESPSQVGLSLQDHLQAKASWLLHSNGTGLDDNLPPGFEVTHPANELNNMLSKIHVINWKCPHKFVLDLTWQVVAGEESKEVELQSKREMRVLEAIYPRPSAIPPNPAFPVELEHNHNNEWETPLIPITPVEDEDTTIDASNDITGPTSLPVNSQPPFQWSGGGSSVSNHPSDEKSAAGKAPEVEPDVAAAASAAFAVIMKTNEQGNMIDRDLLIKILNNPKLIEKMVSNYGADTNPQSIPSSSANISSPSSSAVTANGPFYPQPNGASNPQSIPSSSIVTGNRPFYPQPASGPQSIPSSSTVTANRPFYPQPASSPQSIPSSSTVTANRPFYPQPNGVSNSQPIPPTPVNISSPNIAMINRMEPGPGASSSTLTANRPFYPRPNGVSNPQPIPSGSSIAAGTSSSTVSANRPFYPQPNGAIPFTRPRPPPLPIGGSKDESYYKTLIQQHGGERPGAFPQFHDPVNPFKPIDLRPKIMKPCLYFNSSRGCRHGANCAYQHDVSSQQQTSNMQEGQSGAKRMKMDREITGI